MERWKNGWMDGKMDGEGLWRWVDGWMDLKKDGRRKFEEGGRVGWMEGGRSDWGLRGAQPLGTQLSTKAAPPTQGHPPPGILQQEPQGEGQQPPVHGQQVGTPTPRWGLPGPVQHRGRPWDPNTALSPGRYQKVPAAPRGHPSCHSPGSQTVPGAQPPLALHHPPAPPGTRGSALPNLRPRSVPVVSHLHWGGYRSLTGPGSCSEGSQYPCGYIGEEVKVPRVWVTIGTKTHMVKIAMGEKFKAL